MKFPLQKAEEHMAALWWGRKNTARWDPGEQFQAGCHFDSSLGFV